MIKKPIVLLMTLLFLGNIGHAKVEAKLELKNPSTEIDDGTAKVIVTSGQAPFRYMWSNKGVSIYSNTASGLTEGEEFTVEVIDANNEKVKLTGSVPKKSAVESMNAGFKPVVGIIESVFFWDPFAAVGIADPVIYVEEVELNSPLNDDTTYTNAVLKEWLIADGGAVKKDAVIAVISTDKGDLHLHATGNGKVEHKLKTGDFVVVHTRKDGKLVAKANPVCKIKYDKPQPLLNANGTPKSQGIPLVVIWLVIGAIFFSIRMKFINARGVKHAVELVQGKYDDPDDKGQVSHFQALTTALSATVGLGNIAGVAVAIVAGGAGATFWLIIAGILGMASKFVECTLGVKYRNISDDGEVSGGPMYYLSKGLKKKGMGTLGKVLAGMFAVLCIGGSLGGGNMFQANQAYAQVSSAFGWEGGGLIFGVIMAVLVGIVIIGGIKSIAKVTDKIVPIMCGVYLLFALIIIFMNIGSIGDVFGQIFAGAFSPDAIKGGFIGVLIIGFQRAAFSNEAGVGSAAIAHSAVKTSEPVSEGIVALLEPFIDTVVVCTMTALVLLFTGFGDGGPDGLAGAELTSAAFSSVFDWFKWVLLVAIVMFAFSTMISWSYYGQKAWQYLFGTGKWVGMSYKLIFLVFVVIGSSVGLGAVLGFSDLMVLGMAFPNILGLILMSGEVKEDMEDYFKRVKSGAIKKFK
jgi:AGCS family alanine or glycine:cation symporter